MAFILHSPAFTHEGPIPARYTCKGEDLSPPLEWSGVPEGARSLVLIVDDPDAPDPAAPKMTWVHWVLYDLPPALTRLAEGAGIAAETPSVGGKQGLTDFRRLGYGGPCPPVGKHRYFFKLYALDATLDLPPGKKKPGVVAAMQGHVLAEAQLMGTFGK